MRPTQCKKCKRFYDWERFKCERIDGCPKCKPDDWALALSLNGPIEPLFPDPKPRGRKA